MSLPAEQKDSPRQDDFPDPNVSIHPAAGHIRDLPKNTGEKILQ